MQKFSKVVIKDKPPRYKDSQKNGVHLNNWLILWTLLKFIFKKNKMYIFQIIKEGWNGSNAHKWWKAMHAEYLSLHKK